MSLNFLYCSFLQSFYFLTIFSFSGWTCVAYTDLTRAAKLQHIHNLYHLTAVDRSPPLRKSFRLLHVTLSFVDRTQQTCNIYPLSSFGHRCYIFAFISAIYVTKWVHDILFMFPVFPFLHRLITAGSSSQFFHCPYVVDKTLAWYRGNLPSLYQTLPQLCHPLFLLLILVQCCSHLSVVLQISFWCCFHPTDVARTSTQCEYHPLFVVRISLQY